MKWLIWLYPPRWRSRYADELIATLGETGMSVGIALDVLRGALDAWLHPELAHPVSVSIAAPVRSARGDRFDLFTTRSKSVLRLAEAEAARLHHPNIRAEHLLLGLLLERDGVAAHMLAARGIQAEELQSVTLELLGTGSGFDPTCHGLDPEAKRVIELSVREARRLRHHYVGTEHLLLGLVAAGDSATANLLRERNVADLSSLRHDVLELLNNRSR